MNKTWRKNMNRPGTGTVVAVVLGLMLAAVCAAKAEDAKLPFAMNFEQVEAGKLPDGFLVLEGEFTVKEEEHNKFLELPGAPLDSFGVLFGPTVKSGVAVSARIRSTNKGRRYPTFGVGLNGQSGFKLQVSPGKKALEIYQGDQVMATIPYEWKSGEWTVLRLQIAKSGDVWKVDGKAWTQGAAEPAQPMVSCEDKTEPSPGRASIWGNPYATTPIQYDDLELKSIGTEN
jgi:hypothetical protein